MRSVEEHLAECLRGIEPLSALDVPLLDAQGCILAEDVTAGHPLPAFDHAAVDGYAVRLADVSGASASSPVVLPVVGDVGAGRAPTVSVQEGFTARVQTGAPVPDGTEAVVPADRTDAGIARVEIREPVEAGAFIRRAAEDIAPGDVVLRAGQLIGPGHLGVLAAIGRARVAVRPRPRVVVLSTGDELVEPGAAAGPGKVFEANSYVLTSQAKQAGAIAFRVGVLPDDPRRLVDAIEDQLVRADVVVTSGGLGSRAFDVVREVLGGMGDVDFPTVAMSPGTRQGFGTIGPDGTPLFSLPGEAIASYVSFEVFVRPVLRRMLGVAGPTRPVVRAVCQETVVSRAGVREFVRSELAVDGGRYVVRPRGGDGAHRLVGVDDTNSLLVVPESTTRLEAGDAVEVVVVDRLEA